jgi:hypothetical protein
MKALVVQWYDAAVTEDRWSDIEEAAQSCRQGLDVCRTMGFLLAETDVGLSTHTVHLTATDGVDCVGPITHIPVCSIISRREIDEFPMG